MDHNNAYDVLHQSSHGQHAGAEPEKYNLKDMMENDNQNGIPTQVQTPPSTWPKANKKQSRLGCLVATSLAVAVIAVVLALLAIAAAFLDLSPQSKELAQVDPKEIIALQQKIKTLEHTLNETENDLRMEIENLKRKINQTTEPQPIAATCSAPSTPENGAVTIIPGTNLVEWGLGSVATYSCNAGYSLVGETFRVCLGESTGAWSGTAPSCTRTTDPIPQGNTTVLNCDSSQSCRRLTCPDGNDCIVNCKNESDPCDYSTITCPRNNHCAINCHGFDACEYATFNCPSNAHCVIDCDGYDACEYADIICPEEHDCTINCQGEDACEYTTVTCPTGNYSCNIHCGPQNRACDYLTINNTDHVNLNCCGTDTCRYTNVQATTSTCN